MAALPHLSEAGIHEMTEKSLPMSWSHLGYYHLQNKIKHVPRHEKMKKICTTAVYLINQ